MADVFWGYTHRRRRRKPATQEHLIAPKKRVTQKGLNAETP
jgi:hypothetical protein